MDSTISYDFTHKDFKRMCELAGMQPTDGVVEKGFVHEAADPCGVLTPESVRHLLEDMADAAFSAGGVREAVDGQKRARELVEMDADAHVDELR